MNDKDEATRPQDGAEPDETGTDETGADETDTGEAGTDETGTDDRTDETGTGEAGPRAEDADAALARLVAADPAADVEPRLGVLRAKVDAARADTPADAPTGETPAAAASGDELAARRARRRPWLAAAAVAGVVVIGGAGYAAGTASVLAGGEGASGDVASVSDAEIGVAEPAVPLQGGGADGGAGAATSGEAMGRAGVGGGAADTSYPTWFEGRAIFDGSGLSTAAGTAEAYALDAREVATQESAQRLATALGVEGEPRWSYGAWMVGPEDGQGPTVWLSADGSAYFSYNDPRVDPWRCDVASDGTEACPTPPATQLSDEQARAALLDVMSRIGLDGAAYEVEVQPATGEDPVRWATAYQVVDGRRTGVQLSASVADQGVAWVDGALAQPVSIGEYPVVSPAEAVERLADPRFSGSSWPIAYAEEAGPLDEPVQPAQDEPTPPPGPPAPGAAISWPVSEVTITEARLGLAQHHQRDGSVLVLPTYELADAQGNAWSVLAVADDAIDFDVPPSGR